MTPGYDDDGAMSLSPPSDDGDAFVADLLEQFAAPSTTGNAGAGQERPQQPRVDDDAPRPEETSHREEVRWLTASGVEVPRIENPDGYEYLPGHFTVRRVIFEESTPEGMRYRVKLESREKEWVSSSRLQSLTNGPEALSQFNESSHRSHRSRNEMDSSRRRVSRRQPSEGFVSSSNLIFWDEEEEGPVSAGPARRSLRLNLGPPPSSDEDEYSSSSSSSSGSRIRTTRRSALIEHQREAVSVSSSSSSSEEEEEEEESSDEETSSDNLISSLVTTSRKRRSRRLLVQDSKRRKSARLSGTDSDYAAPRGTRFSTRTRGKPRKSLRERREDDISEYEATPAEKKYTGAKEFFAPVPKDDEFRLRHRGVCDTCYVPDDDDVKGPLVFCQGCTSAYHKACLGPRGAREHLVTKIADDRFILQCRRCIGVAHSKDPVCPHLGYCTECKSPGPFSEPLRGKLTARQEQQLREKNDGKDPITAIDMALVDNVDNVLFRCTGCYRAFHFEHLPPNSEPAHVWDSEGSVSGNVANVRFKEYSRRWLCKDCITHPEEIEALVAWRPVDIDSFIPGYTADVMEEVDKEYLVRWKRKSYYRTTWMPGPWVWGVAAPAMRRAFHKSSKNLKPCMATEDAIPEEYLRVDIVFDVRYSNIVSNRTMEIDLARVKEVKEAYVKFKGLPYEDAVWESLPDPTDVERWNDFKAAYEDWVLRDYVRIPRPGTLKKHLAHVRTLDFESCLLKKTQPGILTGGELMEYQKEGLNWLYYMWYKQQNAILADEMGLGKTIQVISLFATLIQDHRCWPFLVVVPNSTCPNWRREVKTWAPSLRVVTYYGSSAARKIAHDYEMFPEGGTDLRCHIVVTSYEAMVDEKARRVLSSIPWAGLVVDEGQRLKNDKTQLYEALSRINFPFKVLLTGTPLQNNTRELFNLIQFCDPTKNAEALQQKYETLTKENVPELHDMIRPFFLRRTKAQVLTFLPPMAQIIVPVSMSVVQKKLYKSILAKNPQLIKSIFQKNGNHTLKQSERHNLSNILMQLRKCLCHPFVYSKAIEERGYNAAVTHRNLVEASGKLKLLELMLPKLRERGHRVLLFSQFLENLDIVEDFLDGLGLLHRRLDGSMSSLEKQKQIDDFNAPGSPYFAFLLSTRSGGVGINLATADTVIIMDPDFNPHQDIQALSRAHRIGQQKKVLVFQLMTRASAEEKIMQIGKKKMALDHVLIERMDAEDEEGLDLESILRHGAETLFDNDDTGDIHYDSESMERLLDRSQAENTQTGADGSAESQFSFARVWTNDKSTLEDRLGDSESSTPSDTVWEKILRERERAAAEEAAAKAEMFGRGKRKRNVVDYSASNDVAADQGLNVSPQKAGREGESDTEFQVKEGAESEYSEDLDIDSGAESSPKGKKTHKARPFKRVDPAKIAPPVNGQALDGSTDPASRPSPCIACSQIHPVGYCPLKLAGVEHCGLCGIAHLGYQRTCPHLNSETRVALMLGTLKESTEPRHIVEEAKKYLRGIRGDLVRRKKIQETTAAAAATGNHTAHSGPPPTSGTPGPRPVTIDLTNGPPTTRPYQNLYQQHAHPPPPRPNSSAPPPPPAQNPYCHPMPTGYGYRPPPPQQPPPQAQPAHSHPYQPQQRQHTNLQWIAPYRPPQ